MNLFDKIQCKFNNSCCRDIIEPLILSTKDLKTTIINFKSKLKCLNNNFKECITISSIISLKSECLTFQDTYIKYIVSHPRGNTCKLNPKTCMIKYNFEKKRKSRFERILRNIIYKYNQIQYVINDLESFISRFDYSNIILSHGINIKDGINYVLLYNIKDLAEYYNSSVYLFYGFYHCIDNKSYMELVYHPSGSLELSSINSSEENKGYGSILLLYLKIIAKELNNYIVDSGSTYNNEVKYISGIILNKSPGQYERLKEIYKKAGLLKDGHIYLEI